MKRFTLKLGLLLGVNALVGLAVLTVLDMGRSYEQWQHDSVLSVTPRNTDFDLVMLGSSRAKRLTRLKPNLECLERELAAKVLGMGSPFGGGIVPAKLYLGNFYDRGNRAKTVLFLLDPFILFSRGPNEGHKLVYFEPFRLSFLTRMILNGFDHRRIVTYVRTKFSLAWLTQAPSELGYYRKALTPEDLDPERLRMRMDSLYPDGLDEAHFNRYAKVLGEILEMCQRHNTRMVIAFPTTLLGPDPGRPKVLELLDEYAKRYDFEFYDFTDAVTDPGLFADYDHLNSMGVEYFVSNSLKHVLHSAPRTVHLL